MSAATWRRRVAARVLAVEAAVALTAASLWIVVTPRRRLITRLGEPMAAQHRPSTEELTAVATTADEVTLGLVRRGRRVGRMVTRVAGLLPWHPTCLRQAMAVRWMLRRRRVPSVLHLGIADVASMDAHAWVTVQGFTVVGRQARPFIPVAAFGDCLLTSNPPRSSLP